MIHDDMMYDNMIYDDMIYDEMIHDDMRYDDDIIHDTIVEIEVDTGMARCTFRLNDHQVCLSLSDVVRHWLRDFILGIIDQSL